MKNKIIKKPKKDRVDIYKDKFDVVKFMHRNDKLFDCIPEIWFVDENKEACFWPPKTGKSFSLRALAGEMPDDTWLVYECTVISQGHRKF